MKNNFIKIFKEEPKYLFKAPARINLIGEHIDYNGGNVLPCAISLYTYAYVSIRNDNIIKLYSDGLKEVDSIDIKDIKYDEKYDWANYPLGAIYTLISKGYNINHGLNIYFYSTIPLASGLSSSASILDLTIYICKTIYKLDITNEEIGNLAWITEVNYCGLNCGIMDQYSIALGKENQCLLLDTSTRKYEYHKLDLGDYKLLILKTNKPRKLTESKYNERVKECGFVKEILGLNNIKINNLCEVNIDDLNKIKDKLPDHLFRRLRHCVTEQKRVLDFIDALNKNDILKLGKILNESHESLKKDYEVTGYYLDSITSSARKVAIGSRMTGAGFSGCAIAICHKDKIEELKEVVIKEYKEKTGLDAEVLEVEIVSGPNLDLIF